MELQEIINQYEKDTAMLEHQLNIEQMRTPAIHSKYMTILGKERSLLRQHQRDYEVLLVKKDVFYSGRASAATYKATPFDLKIKTRDELIKWVEADKEVQELKTKIEVQEEKIDFVLDMIRQINTRGFSIKNILDFQRFKSGETK